MRSGRGVVAVGVLALAALWLFSQWFDHTTRSSRAASYEPAPALPLVNQSFPRATAVLGHTGDQSRRLVLPDDASSTRTPIVVPRHVSRDLLPIPAGSGDVSVQFHAQALHPSSPSIWSTVRTIAILLGVLALCAAGVAFAAHFVSSKLSRG